MQQARHGDVFIIKTKSLPRGVKPKAMLRVVLAEGKATNHNHVVTALDPNRNYMVWEGEPFKKVQKLIPGSELLQRHGLEFQPDSRKPKMAIVDGEIQFRLHGTGVVEHQEHGSIPLQPGDYRRVIQTEHQLAAPPRRVVD